METIDLAKAKYGRLNKRQSKPDIIKSGEYIKWKMTSVDAKTVMSALNMSIKHESDVELKEHAKLLHEELGKTIRRKGGMMP